MIYVKIKSKNFIDHKLCALLPLSHLSGGKNRTISGTTFKYIQKRFIISDGMVQFSFALLLSDGVRCVMINLMNVWLIFFTVKWTLCRQRNKLQNVLLLNEICTISHTHVTCNLFLFSHMVDLKVSSVHFHWFCKLIFVFCIKTWENITRNIKWKDVHASMCTIRAHSWNRKCNVYLK